MTLAIAAMKEKTTLTYVNRVPTQQEERDTEEAHVGLMSLALQLLTRLEQHILKEEGTTIAWYTRLHVEEVEENTSVLGSPTLTSEHLWTLPINALGYQYVFFGSSFRT